MSCWNVRATLTKVPGCWTGPKRILDNAVSWPGLANIHYLSRDGAWEFIEELTDFCVVPGAGTTEMKRALGLGLKDLGDAMQVSTALLFGAQLIVTRNLSDYKRSPIKAVPPGDPALFL